jgi:hypothetical protein
MSARGSLEVPKGSTTLIDSTSTFTGKNHRSGAFHSNTLNHAIIVGDIEFYGKP